MNVIRKNQKKRPIVGFLFKLSARVFSLFSLRWNHRIGTFVGLLLRFVPNKIKSLSEKHIAIAFPDWNESERKKLLNESLGELSKTYIELGPLWLWSQHRIMALVRYTSGVEKIEQALAHGKGAILLSPHLGAWELAGRYGSILFPISSLYRPPRVKSIDNFIRKARQTDGAKLFPTDMVGIKALRKALKNNEIVGILPDQDPGKSGSIVAPFFGRPANTMLLVAKLGKKTGCPIFFTFAERLPDGFGYRIHVIEADNRLTSIDDLVAATLLNKGIENCIRLVPSQYQWSYKRYKNVVA